MIDPPALPPRKQAEVPQREAEQPVASFAVSLMARMLGIDAASAELQATRAHIFNETGMFGGVAPLIATAGSASGAKPGPATSPNFAASVPTGTLAAARTETPVAIEQPPAPAIAEAQALAISGPAPTNFPREAARAMPMPIGPQRSHQAVAGLLAQTAPSPGLPIRMAGKSAGNRPAADAPARQPSPSREVRASADPAAISPIQVALREIEHGLQVRVTLAALDGEQRRHLRDEIAALLSRHGFSARAVQVTARRVEPHSMEP